MKSVQRACIGIYAHSVATKGFVRERDVSFVTHLRASWISAVALNAEAEKKI